jgi:hypothetical protein
LIVGGLIRHQVWKELCRRDFGSQLDAYKEALRHVANDRSSAGGGDDGLLRRLAALDAGRQPPEAAIAVDEEGSNGQGTTSLFNKVLATGLGLRLGRGSKGSSSSSKSGLSAAKTASPSDNRSYKDLYRVWAHEVLIIYHVYSHDEAEKDVERFLRLEGIEGVWALSIRYSRSSLPPPQIDPRSRGSLHSHEPRAHQ